MSIVLFVVALFFNCYWIWYLYTKNNCKKEVQAIYMGKEKFRGGTMGNEFIMVFRYDFNGTIYEEKSFETYRKKQIKDQYIEKKEYIILVNEKHPQYYVLDRKVQSYDALLIAVGLISAALFVLFMMNR